MDSAGFESSFPSPRVLEDPLAMFFDFGTPVQEAQNTYKNTTQSHESRGGIRVSLACVPCRSRHVKCGAEMPSCSRCQQDDKPCFYAKSRRGMRDKNAPRKRNSAKEQSRGRSVRTEQGGYSTPKESHVGNSSSELWTGALSDASLSPNNSSSRLDSIKPVDSRRLIDLYYNFFHKAHPYIIPKPHFLGRLKSDPDSLDNLLPVMQYIGSLYAPDLPSAEFRAIALSQLDLPSLPQNGFSVQALLLLAIAIHAEDERGKARAILDRDICMALEIGMNHQNFAGLERDSVLAESWRRTYWGLYVLDGIFSGIACASCFILSAVETHVDLPCEDHEFDSGHIPRPRTLSEYDSRDFEDEIPIFSSFTYLIDLVRIIGTILSINNITGKNLEPAVTNADAMLVNWKLHLPIEKQGVVDKNEEVDELLFQAQNLLQTLLVVIHRRLSRLYHSPLEKISRCARPPPTSPPTDNEDLTRWLHTKKTIEAAQTALNLYALPSPILLHTPLGICGITKATLANLSACAYVYDNKGDGNRGEREGKESTEWRMARDRIRLGLGAIKVLAGVWEGARGTERELKIIARGVSADTSLGVERNSWSTPGVSRGAGSMSIHGAFAEHRVEFEGSGGDIMGRSFEEDFSAGDLEYLGILNGLSVGTNSGIVESGGTSNCC
ncbi:hypothetical protein sscle_05g043640 [Sclerotinia sclerotiorum 1980 UF-70]|uniref:Zn(2)-C6 fungal-type domain-containing protein n=1 Tax=Sclerotinia sclerotiorum (strain ATCC 18683 / 1980 / Ss-1) TaxID=665079 RepID=A0A1D9Q3R4_SCLS1|nr:hypothetical protein sscle_05g043640 [Sclerotinia sclerotiorum 1980 UF-70]